MARLLTRDEKRRLAGDVIRAAAEMLERRPDVYGLDEETSQAGREQVALWLSGLPGDEWDMRLPDPEAVRARRRGA